MDIVRESLKLISGDYDFLLTHDEIINFCNERSGGKNFITRVYAMIILYWCKDIDDKLDKYIDYPDKDYNVMGKLSYLDCLYDVKELLENIIRGMTDYNTSGDISCSKELYYDFIKFIYDIKCPDIDKFGRCMLYDE